jgi:hypothetical protein
MRRAALVAGLGLLMAILAGLASFAVLERLVMSYAFELASFTFIGEVLLMLWLLMFAFRGKFGGRPGHRLTAQTTIRSSGSGSRS